MARFAPFIWVLGNHDPAPPEGLGGQAAEEWRAGPFAVPPRGTRGRGARRNLRSPSSEGVDAHARGTVVTRPCFVCDARRIMLPALGAYTGGLDVRDPAIARLFPRGGRVFCSAATGCSASRCRDAVPTVPAFV